MKAVRVWFVLVGLLISVHTAHADGMFAPGMKSLGRIDPNSHAADITEPEQKAIIVHANGVERLILQVSFKGSAESFAWLVPTPLVPKVTTASDAVFHHLHFVTAPRTRYWLDADPRLQGQYFGDTDTKLRAMGMPTEAPSVDVIQEKTLGVYDITVLRARVAGDLVGWLRAHHYMVDPRIEPVVSDYIKRGWVFNAMRIDRKSQSEVDKSLQEGTLQSLMFEFRSREAVYPLLISSLNPGKTKVLIYVLGEHRMDAAGFQTTCALTMDYYGWYLLGDRFLESISFNTDQYLTKLTADLSPGQMTTDLIIRRAKTDEELHPQPVSPPFRENLGAATLLVVRTGLQPPWSIGVFAALVAAALTPFGRKQRIPLLAIPGVVLLSGPLIVGKPYNMLWHSVNPRYYTVLGDVIIAVPLAIVAMVLILKFVRRKVFTRREEIV